MSATIVSLIRTYVPIGVGAFIAWLLTLGIQLDPEAEAGLVVGLTGVVIAAYYGAVRWLEKRWPWIGVLLGVPAEPAYDTRPVNTRTPAEVEADERLSADMLARLNRKPEQPHARWTDTEA